MDIRRCGVGRLAAVLTMGSAASLVQAETFVLHPDDGSPSRIQDAIDAASNGDTILVGPGVYTGTPLTPAVMQTNGKQLVIQSTNGAEETIIDGQGVRRGLLCENGEPIDTVIDGFMLTGFDSSH